MDTVAARSPDFRALFESAPNLFLLLDAKLEIVAVSDAYCAATKTVREQIVGRPLFSVFPDNPDDAAADGVSVLHRSLTRVLKTGQADRVPMQKYDIPRPANEGGGFEERYWAPLNTPVLEADGKVGWILNQVEDVTEFVRMQAQGELSQRTIQELRDANISLALRNEENAKLQHDLTVRSAQLQEASSFLDLVVENIPAMVAVKDATDGRFVLLNRAGEELTGIPRSESIGKNDYEFFPKDQADLFVAGDRRVLESGALEVIPEETIVTRHKGSRTLRTLKLPVPDQEGRPKYLLAMSVDITEQKQVESQLRQAQKMEAIGNLTGGLAHDFNNLLSVVIGNIDLLRERFNADPESDELAEQALSAALRGAELTQRLLAFARKQPLQPRQIDLNDLVVSISKLMRRTLGDNIEINHLLEEAVWPIVADPAQLEASLLNLATNARDAMPQGGQLQITTANKHLDEDYASLHPGLAAGDYALIEVTDNGAGMTKQTMAQIFEPFFTTKREGHGTGLGLSMVFGFMKQSEGHINVYSEVGVGTTFRLYLPRAAKAPKLATASVQAVEHARGNETVLAVEDNPALRDLVVRQLTQLGYACIEASDGPAALAILESRTVDVIFSDVIMPGGMSGYDLGRAALSRWPSIKVLLTSGFPEEKLNGNGNPPWNIRLLSKPYRKEDLARIIRDTLDAG